MAAFFFAHRNVLFKPVVKILVGFFFLFAKPVSAFAQICPPNIDFESGSFDHWDCYTGNTTAINGENQINLYPSGPTADSHTMIANSSALDPYGQFPVSCPNGSGYSIKLGNDRGGGEAEGISYTFTIPANQNEYSLIYHYAVVFQDPHHEVFQQPRMVVEVSDLTDNRTISCATFTFIPYGSILPGFFESSVHVGDQTPIWCKNWSAVSVNLDGLAGKTIRLFFKTADCTFRRHFGYAYIDVNSECSSEFVGASFCNADTAINVTAPFGYQQYKWFNSDFTRVLGTEQVIHFQPPPPPGTTIAVEVIPYNDYGCIDTFYAKLVDTLTVRAVAGPDKLYCGTEPVLIGSNSKPGLVYQWAPDVGLSSAVVSNPRASPDTTMTYTLTVRSPGGGCYSSDTVVVRASSIDSSLKVIGKTIYCLGNGDSAILNVKPASRIQWFRDGNPIPGEVQPVYRVTQSGSYSAHLVSSLGCEINTRPQVVVIDKARPGIMYPIQYAAVDLPQQLEARSFGATVLWEPATELDHATIVAPLFKGETDQLYTIRIETATECVTVDTQMVKIVPRADILVPSAFTPNADGRNDVLRPTLMGIKQLTYFRVFNRWGNLLFESHAPQLGWDGTIKGKPQEAGVVVWIAEGVGADGRVYFRKGTSVLIR